MYTFTEMTKFIRKSLSLWLFLLSYFTESLAYQKNTVMIPMRDGIRLATDIYLPSVRPNPIPCILVRTPYGKNHTLDEWLMFILTDLLQYAIVIQDTRGRYASEGIDSLYFSDGWGRVRDGYDTIEWLAEQPWCNGKIGMFGASAMGITQYLAAGTNPPHLRCCVVMVAASNLYEDAIFYRGEFQKALVEGWLHDVGKSEFISFFIAHPNYAPIYDSLNLMSRLDSVNVPILHMGGWYDIFTQGTLNAFVGIQERGGPLARGKQKLIMGPWVHDISKTSCGELVFPNSDSMEFLDDIIAFMEEHLKGISPLKTMPPVQYYLMGDPEAKNSPGNRWVESESWPPPTTQVSLYLREGGRLSFEPPSETEPPHHFDFNPNDPVPTVGGRNLNLPAGAYNQSQVEDRPDVLVYTSDVLADSIVVVGRIRVKLWASSDAWDTDFTAKLCDVYPSGKSMLIADGIIQARHRNSLEKEEFLVPNEATEFVIDLWSTAIAFAPGHQIRVSISSSNYPRFKVNPNTGKPFGDFSEMRIAHQTIYHDRLHPSAIELPVINPPSTLVVKNRTQKPEVLFLGQNYPNPFNGQTLIPCRIPDNQKVDGENFPRLMILNTRGEKVKEWYFSNPQTKTFEIHWDGKDEKGFSQPSGMYIAKFQYGNHVQSIKMVLAR